MEAENVAPVVENTVAPEDIVKTDPLEALKDVMKSARFQDGLLRGIRECVKAVDSRTAVLCLLAADCDNQQYTKLVTALCKDRGVPLMQVESKTTLGEWAGLCRHNEQGEACKIIPCSCAALTNWGESTPVLDTLREHLKTLA